MDRGGSGKALSGRKTLRGRPQGRCHTLQTYERFVSRSHTKNCHQRHSFQTGGKRHKVCNMSYILKQTRFFFIFWFRFQAALVEYGVDEADIFQTNDLSEKKDIANVTNTLYALGRAVST